MVQEFAPAPRWCSKKNSRRLPRAAICSCSTRLPVLAPPHARREVAAWSRWPDPPPSPLLRPYSPSVTDAVLFGRLTGRQLDLQYQVSPTCDGPMAAPRQRLGPALTPVDAAPRRLPLREDRYSTWGDARYFSGSAQPRFKVGMLSICPWTCWAGLQVEPCDLPGYHASGL